MTKSQTLIADIGGTNARFALASNQASESQSVHYHTARTLQVSEHADVESAIRSYLSSVEVTTVSAICLAVAGPLINQEVRFLNSHWHIRASALAEHFKCEQVWLLNDWEAIAYSLPTLTAEDVLHLGGGAAALNQTQEFVLAALGPGSGLGISGLIKKNGALVPLISEGGHAGFAAETPLQIEILRFLRGKFGYRISRERLLSGPGLMNIHEALCEIQKSENPGLGASEIAIAGIAGHDELCTETMQIFFEILGQVAGDLALAYGAYQGVFIGGGIVQRYPDALLESRFRYGFENKGRHEEFMKNIPSWLITHQNPGLVGAASYARQQSKKST